MIRIAKRGAWAVLAALAFSTAGCNGVMGNYEEPRYTLVESRGNIEVRKYPERVVAEVQVTGDRKAAANAGFRAIAGYIFGNNSPKEKIAMTTPVTQQRSRQEIPMTTPVTQQEEGGSWQVRFFMPATYSIDSLPRPGNPDVKLHTVAPQMVVAIRFSGRWTNSNMQAHIEQLRAYVVERKLQTVGEPIMAFYNPPWTLPFLRRNEIMLVLAE